VLQKPYDLAALERSLRAAQRAVTREPAPQQATTG
jgi:hypothetical protein